MPIPTCIDCDGTDIEERMLEQSFPYGPPGSVITLKVTVPVWCCKCGAQWTDYRGEEIRDAAVRKLREYLMPDDVRIMPTAKAMLACGYVWSRRGWRKPYFWERMWRWLHRR